VGLFGQETQRLFIARPDTAKGQLVYKRPDTNIRKATFRGKSVSEASPRNTPTLPSPQGGGRLSAS
jgi:hypothetical protein